MKRILTCVSICLVIQCLASAQVTVDDAPRKLAPGVITTIRNASIDDAAVDKTREFTELLATISPPDWQPNFDPKTQTLLDKAKGVSLQREVWSLEFGFKPLRVIEVDGRPIWYLIYFVRNTGDVRYAVTDVEKIDLKSRSKPVRFLPSFVLQAHDLKREYPDTIRPDLIRRIAQKERVTRGVLHGSLSIARQEIPVSTPDADRRVWGVAIWDNVDSRADLISVFVLGLTNAYQWDPPKDGYKAKAGEQDTVRSRALQLNFWRGGDDVDLHDGEMLYGIPLYPNDPARQANVLKAYQIDRAHRHRWVYR